MALKDTAVALWASHPASARCLSVILGIVTTVGCAGAQQLDSDRLHGNSPNAGNTTGREIPDSAVRVPAKVEALTILEGRAPPTSVVETQTGSVTVGDDGRFALQAPSEGTWTIRVRRPAPLTSLRFNVLVHRGGQD